MFNIYLGKNNEIHSITHSKLLQAAEKSTWLIFLNGANILENEAVSERDEEQWLEPSELTVVLVNSIWFVFCCLCVLAVSMTLKLRVNLTFLHRMLYLGPRKLGRVSFGPN